MTIEEKLNALARCGLKLKDQFGVADLAESWGREALDEPGWNLTLVCLGMTQEEPPWTPHCDNLWHFDTDFAQHRQRALVDTLSRLRAGRFGVRATVRQLIEQRGCDHAAQRVVRAEKNHVFQGAPPKHEY